MYVLRFKKGFLYPVRPKRMSGKRNQLPPVQRQSIEEATAEAEARPLEYNPNERAKYVREHLQNIAMWMSQGDSEETIRARVPEFAENYKELFKKIIQKQDLPHPDDAYHARPHGRRSSLATPSFGHCGSEIGGQVRDSSAEGQWFEEIGTWNRKHHS